LTQRVEAQERKLEHSINFKSLYQEICRMEDNEAIKELESTILSYEILKEYLEMDK
jgi:hypothetical protein